MQRTKSHQPAHGRPSVRVARSGLVGLIEGAARRWTGKRRLIGGMVGRCRVKGSGPSEGVAAVRGAAGRRPRDGAGRRSTGKWRLSGQRQQRRPRRTAARMAAADGAHGEGVWGPKRDGGTTGAPQTEPGR